MLPDEAKPCKASTSSDTEEGSVDQYQASSSHDKQGTSVDQYEVPRQGELDQLLEDFDEYISENELANPQNGSIDGEESDEEQPINVTEPLLTRQEMLGNLISKLQRIYASRSENMRIETLLQNTVRVIRSEVDAEQPHGVPENLLPVPEKIAQEDLPPAPEALVQLDLFPGVEAVPQLDLLPDAEAVSQVDLLSDAGAMPEEGASPTQLTFVDEEDQLMMDLSFGYMNYSELVVETSRTLYSMTEEEILSQMESMEWV